MNAFSSQEIRSCSLAGCGPLRRRAAEEDPYILPKRRPLLPRIIDGRPWETYSTEEILSAPRFWQYGEKRNEKEHFFPTHGSIRAKSFSPRAEKDVRTLPCFFPSIFRKEILPLKNAGFTHSSSSSSRGSGRKSRGSRFHINRLLQTTPGIVPFWKFSRNSRGITT